MMAALSQVAEANNDYLGVVLDKDATPQDLMAANAKHAVGQGAHLVLVIAMIIVYLARLRRGAG